MSFLDLNKSFLAAIFESEGLRSVIFIDFSLCPQTSPFGAYHCEPLITLYLGVSQHAPIPLCTSIQSFASNFEKSHPIKKNVTYQLWSLMKQGVIVLNDSTSGSVYTDGAVGAVDSNSKNVLLVLQQIATCLLSSVGKLNNISTSPAVYFTRCKEI